MTDIPTPATATPRRRRRLTGFVGGLAVVAILVGGFVITAAWARRGYFVDFDDSGNVAIYRGRADGFLWFDPTVDAVSDLNRAELDVASIARVEKRSEFDSREDAEEFVAGRLDTTTTTTTSTTTTTTTTTSTTTTTPATTTTVAATTTTAR